MKQSTNTTTLAVCAALLLAMTVPALAGGTARASANQRVYDGPGDGYAVIGMLPKDQPVELVRCTRKALWCLFRDADGYPAGWVRGGYLIGIGAVSAATPPEFDHGLIFQPFPTP